LHLLFLVMAHTTSQLWCCNAWQGGAIKGVFQKGVFRRGFSREWAEVSANAACRSRSANNELGSTGDCKRPLDGAVCFGQKMKSSKWGQSVWGSVMPHPTTQPRLNARFNANNDGPFEMITGYWLLLLHWRTYKRGNGRYIW